MGFCPQGAFLRERLGDNGIGPVKAQLTAVEGRKLVFRVSLHDEKGPVGGGVHERFIINNAKFAAKAEAKKG